MRDRPTIGQTEVQLSRLTDHCVRERCCIVDGISDPFPPSTRGGGGEFVRWRASKCDRMGIDPAGADNGT